MSATGTRRSNRYAASSSASASSRSFHASTSFAAGSVDRRPVIVEIGSTLIRAGHADQFRPQHLIPLNRPLFEKDADINNGSNNNYNNHKTETEWYLALAPVIELVYDRLMVKPSTRRVVCVTHTLVPTTYLRALQQHFWNRGVPSVAFLETLQVLPVALGFHRGLMVQMTRDETVCACHADGYVMPFTFQAVPTGYQAMLKACGGGDAPAANAAADVFKSSPQLLTLPSVYTKDLDRLLLDPHNPNSIVAAILLCLKDCPRDLRAHVVSNIVFAGDGVTLLPDVPRRVVKHIQQMFEQGSSSGDDEGPDESDPALGPNDASNASANASAYPMTLSMVSMDYASLQPLATRIRLVSCAPHRPDCTAWVGASLYATTWMKYDDVESPIPWVYPPTLNEEAAT